MRPEESMRNYFLNIYDKHADALFRYGYFRVGNREMAKDMVQETFFKTYEYIMKNGLKSVKNIKAFLYKVMRNAIVDEMRKKRPLSLDALIDEGFQPIMAGTEVAGALYSKIDGESMLKLLLKLDPREKEAVILRYVGDLSPKEIAEISDESANVISVRISRALQKIRNMLT